MRPALAAQPGRHHAIWKEWRRIGKGQDARYFLEHRQAVLESLRGERPPRQILLSRGLHGQDPEGWESLARRRAGVSWYLLDDQSLDQVASVPASSGLCAIFEPAPVPLPTLLDCRFLLLAWELSDPGNLGTLVRAVQALGEGGMIAVGGCQPWAAKVARSSAGTLLKAKLAHVRSEEGEAVLRQLRGAGFALRAAYPRSGARLQDLTWDGKVAVLLGNESRGLPEELREAADPFVIPMASEVESLNVATTGAIVCWEWRRSQPE